MQNKIAILIVSIIPAAAVIIYKTSSHDDPFEKTVITEELSLKGLKQIQSSSEEISDRENDGSTIPQLPNKLYTESNLNDEEISKILNISSNEIHPIKFNDEYIEKLKIDETLSIDIPNLGTIDYTIQKIRKGEVNYLSGYLSSDPSRMQEIYITWKNSSYFGSVLTHHGIFTITTINDKQYLFFGNQETID